MDDATEQVTRWWRRPDLTYRQGDLVLDGDSVAGWAEAAGTPCFLYAAGRIRDNARRVLNALEGAGLRGRLYYAMKANRFAPLLTWLRQTGLCGIDACSPEEVMQALACGFPPRSLLYTATSVSDPDLDVLRRFPDILMNVDSLSALRRLADRQPGRRIGLRVNPGVGLGYRENALLEYAGSRPTKFGLYEDQVDEALAIAEAAGFRIVALHVHAGCGYLTDQLDAFDEVLGRVESFLDRVPEVELLNVGGGLGVPYQAGDAPLDLQAWARVIARRFGARNLAVAAEPGDYLVRDAGVLTLRVNTVEQKQGTTFVGVDGGFHLNMYPAFYNLPLEVVPCRPRPGSLRPVTLAGNINEALDLLGEDVGLPPIEEGDLLAFLHTGGYSSSMSSDHCRRGSFREFLLFPESREV